MSQPQTTPLEREAAFFEALSHLERGPLAELRRGASLERDQRPYFLERLLFDHLPAWQGWAREAAYLVASLYALVERPNAEGARESEEATPTLPEVRKHRTSLGRDLGKLYRDQDERPSTEKRFLALLDADEEQFPYQLRQAVTLLNAADIRPYWPQLLSDARAWGNVTDPRFRDRETVRDQWARDFYRPEKPEANTAVDTNLTSEEQP